MTPNFRFNKKLTKSLLKSIPCEEEKLIKQTIDWNLDQGNVILGSWSDGWFGNNTIFILLRRGENYCLVIGGNKGIYGIYMIDDINEYIDYIGIEKLDLINTEELLSALKNIEDFPLNGIIVINEEKIFIYDYKDYKIA